MATGLITVVGNRAVRGSRLDDPLTLEKVLADHPLPHPECVAGKGDDPAPFDAEAINARLRKVAQPG